MPLGRYFLFVGGILLALLFYADWQFSDRAIAPDSDAALGSDIDRTTLRIKSDHKWPERVVIDTSLPAIVPPRNIADSTPPSRDPREAFARLSSPAPAIVPSHSAGIAPKAVHQRKPKLARRARPDSYEAYQQASVREWLPPGW